MEPRQKRVSTGKLIVHVAIVAILAALAAAAAQYFIVGEVNPAVTGGVAGAIAAVSVGSITRGSRRS